MFTEEKQLSFSIDPDTPNYDEVERQLANKTNVITTVDDLMSNDEDDKVSVEIKQKGKPAQKTYNRVDQMVTNLTGKPKKPN